MAQGQAEALITILKKRIANGERPIVEDEFMRLSLGQAITSTQTQDLKVDQNPEYIYWLSTCYAIALGHSTPNLFASL